MRCEWNMGQLCLLLYSPLIILSKLLMNITMVRDSPVLVRFPIKMYGAQVCKHELRSSLSESGGQTLIQRYLRSFGIYVLTPGRLRDPTFRETHFQWPAMYFWKSSLNLMQPPCSFSELYCLCGPCYL